MTSSATDNAGNIQVVPDTAKMTIDTTPPKTPNIGWADDWHQQIWMDWRWVKDAVKYRVYSGAKPNELIMVDETKNSF